MGYCYDATRIQDEMARRKWTLKDFAQAAELSPTTARFVVYGGKALSFRTLGKVAAAFGIDPPSSLIVEPAQVSGGV